MAMINICIYSFTPAPLPFILSIIRENYKRYPLNNKVNALCRLLTPFAPSNCGSSWHHALNRKDHTKHFPEK